MTSDDLRFASITTLARKLRNGDITVDQIVNKSLEVIGNLDSELNAFLEVWSDDVREKASEAQRSIEIEKSASPLTGIPVGLKDLVDVHGRSTTAGSKVLQGNVAAKDATIVKRMTAAGAIPVGKLNLVEFAFGTTGLNAYTGNVSNPWDKTRVTAGSSSGSGASVAAGMVPAAIGTDTGGSIRMPAALCGIAGLKPTYGRVSRAGVLDLSWSMDHVGPMTRTVEDCALMMNALAGFDQADPASSSEPVGDFTSELAKGFDGVRLGLPKQYFFDDFVDPEIKNSVLGAIKLMETNGAEIVELDADWISLGRRIGFGVIAPEALAVHRKNLGERPDDYTMAVRSRILAGVSISAVDYIEAQRARKWFSHEVANLMQSVDAIVTPTVPIPTPTIEECTPTSTDPGGGGQMPFFTGVFNTTGQPSLSIPCGFGKFDMPIGMMITGHSFDESTVLRIGHAYEQLTDWHQRKPNDIE